MNMKDQGHSLTFVRGHSDSIFSNCFCSETARSIEAKFHMEPPWDVRNENLFKCSRSHDHAHIWWKISKVFFFGTKRLMTLKLGIQHQVLEYYQCFHTMTLGWPSPFLWQGQIFLRMLLYGWKQGYRNFEIQIGPLNWWRHRHHTNMRSTIPNHEN